MNEQVNVVVLLSAYNGETYIEQQIDSVLKQKNVNVHLLVRDDGSKDRTVDILKRYKRQGLLDYYTGDNLKPANSFMDLVYSAPMADYYAFCDQDDYWLDDKLTIAISKLEKEDRDIPLLYYGMPRIVNEKLEPLSGGNTLCETMTTFDSCLVNSKATGCTMVFNQTLCEELKDRRPDYVLMHDAWAHKVCLALDGKVIFDPDVHILYRQHGGNVVGVPSGLMGKIRLYFLEFKNSDQMRSRCIDSLLKAYGDKMTTEKKEKAELVANYRKTLFSRFRLLFNREIKTNYWKRNVVYKLAVLFGKF